MVTSIKLVFMNACLKEKKKSTSSLIHWIIYSTDSFKNAEWHHNCVLLNVARILRQLCLDHFSWRSKNRQV